MYNSVRVSFSFVNCFINFYVVSCQRHFVIILVTEQMCTYNNMCNYYIAAGWILYNLWYILLSKVVQVCVHSLNHTQKYTGLFDMNVWLICKQMMYFFFFVTCEYRTLCIKKTGSIKEKFCFCINIIRLDLPLFLGLLQVYVVMNIER